MMGPLFELRLTPAAPGSRDVASTLYRQLKAAILDGRVREGTRLPSSRSAPAMFGVSRNTTQDVYERLAHEGLVEARHGSGTYVARADRVPAPAAPPDVARAPTNGLWATPELARWMGFWRHGSEIAPTGAPAIDLRPALIDPTLFPHATFRRSMARELRRLERAAPSSGSPFGNQGSRRLRAAIAGHLALTRAIAVDADDVLVTSGAQQAFDLIARVMVRPGETVVAVEDPGYPPMRVPFAAAGAQIAPVRIDEEGIVVDEIPAEARIVCVCPSHQFPLGMSLSPRRRQALLRFAGRTGAIVVEDDYDGEFRYDGSPLEALKSDAASADSVFYVGSFTKSMFPSLRLGFLVAPRWALPELVSAKNMTDWHCSVPLQAAVANFVEGGHLSRHVASVRREYGARRQRLLTLLGRHAGDLLQVVPSSYGMHVAAFAADGVACEEVSEALARRSVLVHTLRRYHLGAAARTGFVFGFGSTGASMLDQAIGALGVELRGGSRHRGGGASPGDAVAR